MEFKDYNRRGFQIGIYLPAVFVVYLNLMIVTQVTGQMVIPASDFTADVCTNNADCEKKYKNVVCAQTTPTDGAAVTKRCACKSYFGFHLLNADCFKQVTKIGNQCDPTKNAICSVANSACVDSGMNTNTKMCMCNANFVSVSVNGTDTCASVIGSLQDPACAECEKNNGVCYTLTTKKREGCKCIISQTGQNCETKLVNVQCIMKDMAMKICFTPHAGLNFSMQTTSLRVYDTKAASCKSVPADGTTCPTGQQQLVLSLNATDLSTCKISATPIGDDFRYEAKLMVSSINALTAVYSVYCNYQKSAAVGSVSATRLLAQNDQGGDLKPNITLTVLNNFLDPINVILVGQSIYLRVILYKNDTYGAAILQDCTISGKQQDKFCDQCNRKIITTGCPVQDGLLTPNSIQYDNNDPTKHVITVGPFKSFKFPKFSLLYVHCKLSLCLLQETDKCPVPTCSAASATTPAGTGGSTAGASTAGATTAGGGAATTGGTTAPAAGRRKRDVGDRPSYVTSNGYYVYDPQELNDKVVLSLGTFAGVLALLLALIVVLAVVAIVLCCRMKKRNDKVADFEPKTPVGNHFALPRINRNNMRI